MARYEVPVEVRLPAGRPARVADNGRPSERNQLTVRVSGDRVSAR